MARDNARGAGHMTSQPPRKQESAGGAALAEALRRAAEKSGRGKTV
jgi:uncharacterized protein